MDKVVANARFVKTQLAQLPCPAFWWQAAIHGTRRWLDGVRVLGSLNLQLRLAQNLVNTLGSGSRWDWSDQIPELVLKPLHEDRGGRLAIVVPLPFTVENK